MCIFMYCYPTSYMHTHRRRYPKGINCDSVHEIKGKQHTRTLIIVIYIQSFDMSLPDMRQHPM